jgi:HNH endonuclease
MFAGAASRANHRFRQGRASVPTGFELLEQRQLHLTAIALLSKYLTDENHRELLGEARGKTKQQILEMLVQRFPKADVRSHLRRIPGGAVAAGPTAALEPRSTETYCLQLNASRELKAKLEQARDLMSHANPSGDLALVVERALELLIQNLKTRRFGQTGESKTRRFGQTGESKTRRFGQTGESTAGCVDSAQERDARHEPPALDGCSGPAAKKPHKRRRIRQDVRRQVAERDAERCCHMGPDGRRCEARAFLQLHHQRPWALGGADSVDNLQLLCRAHNRLAAELELGADRVAQAIERRRQPEGQRRCNEG